MEESTPSSEENSSFNIIYHRNRLTPEIRVTFICDNIGARDAWVKEIEATLLGYHRDTMLSSLPGWFHDLIQGSLHSTACVGTSLKPIESQLNLM